MPLCAGFVPSYARKRRSRTPGVHRAAGAALLEREEELSVLLHLQPLLPRD